MLEQGRIEKMKEERHYKINEMVYFPMTDEHGQFRLMLTRVVGIEKESMSIYSFAYHVYVNGTLYRVHFDDLFPTLHDFCEEAKYRVVVDL